jgi:hypothetical protein
MLPQAGVPGLQVPPGDPGYMAFPGAGPQEAGMPFGNEPGQVPGVPQAWANSMWNPTSKLRIRTEALWLKPNFQRSSPMASQPGVQADGTFAINELPVSPHTPYYLTPRLSVEYFCTDYFSIEATGFAMIGPHRTYNLGSADFSYFLSGTFAGDVSSFTAPFTNIPAGFPTVADIATVFYSQNIGNFELMGWWHWTPDKGACSDVALGIGGRYFFINEKINLRFEDKLGVGSGMGATSGELDVRSKNDLFGVQVGGKATMQSPLKWLRSTVEGKIALMNNDARNNTQILDTTGAVVGNGRITHSDLAFLFEGNLNVEFFVSQYVTAYAGFNVVYIDRVERADQQLNTDLNAFVQPTKHNGDVLLFGPKVGFMMNW